MDKAGLYACLEILKRLSVIKIFLATQEEIGARGSKQANPEFFKNCTMLLQIDRNSYNGPELITYTNGIEVCSTEFTEAAKDIMEKYNYKPARGVYTDIGEIKKLPGVECIACNIGAAYFSEHSDQEVLYTPGYENSVNFTYEIIKSLGNKKWVHIAKEEIIEIESIEEGKFSKYPYSPKLFSDYSLYDAPYKKSERKKHYCPDFNFTSLDDAYIQDSIDTGQCPYCSSNELEELIEDETHCWHCGSTYNIPEDKSLLEVEEELLEIIEMYKEVEDDIEEEIPDTKQLPRDNMDWAEC